MPFAGYLASTGRFSLVLAATAGAVGCNIGSTLAYAVGARGGRPLVERWGRYILLSPGDLDRAERFFHRFGGPAVLIGRLLPVIRTFIALPAGPAPGPGATPSPTWATCSGSGGTATRGCALPCTASISPSSDSWCLASAGSHGGICGARSQGPSADQQAGNAMGKWAATPVGSGATSIALSPALSTVRHWAPSRRGADPRRIGNSQCPRHWLPTCPWLQVAMERIWVHCCMGAGAVKILDHGARTAAGVPTQASGRPVNHSVRRPC